MKGYVILALSIVSEVLGTSMLKMSDGFTVLLPSIGVMAAYGLSFFWLALCLKTIPLSLAYAIWSGAGTALTAIVGILVFGGIFSILKILGIILIIGGVVLLNSSKDTETADGTEVPHP